MVVLSFHPEAEKNFDQQANKVIGLIECRQIPESPRAAGPQPEVHAFPVQVDTRGPTTGGLLLPDGSRVAIYRDLNGKRIGYFDAAYKDLEALAIKIHKNPSVRDLVSTNEIIDSIFEWSIKNYNELKENQLIQDIISNIKPKIKEHEIWVPINGLMIIDDIHIGQITLRSLTKDLIGKWCEACKKNSKFPPGMMDALFQRDFLPMQGYAAGVVKITGTMARAVEVALEDVARVVEIIRAFQFPAIRSGVRSYIALKGQEASPTEFTFTIGPEGTPRSHRSIIGAMPMELLIDQKIFHHLQMSNVWYACSWLSRNRTDLEEHILQSLSLLSKSALTTELSDRLVYVFAALESLLVANETDPIMNAVAERFAFFSADKGDDRIELRDRIRRAYGMRSRFVHHGHEPSDREMIDAFLYDVHLFFMMLVGRSKDFQSKDALLKRIDEIKFNGESFGQYYPDTGNP